MNNFEAMFDLAPVSLWLEDYSGLHALFNRLRAEGVTDLRAYLGTSPERVAECSRELKVLRVNRRTLQMFGAEDTAHLLANLDRVFRNDGFERKVEELASLWSGGPAFSGQTVNYTLDGRRLDIHISVSVLPGHEADWSRLLVAIEDITDQVRAERQSARNAAYARGLFEHSPVSLWVEDFSAIKQLVDALRRQGVDDLRTHVAEHPEFVARCMHEMRVKDVNQHTLVMFGAPDKPSLLASIGAILADTEAHPQFADQLVGLWNGDLFQQRELVYHRLDGSPIHVHMQLSVLPGAEDDWCLVQIALTDITARKKAELRLAFLGKHDALTHLRNRAHFEDELDRLERDGPFPITIIVLDVNGLKKANDQHGHRAGDRLLRRAGEVLGELDVGEVCAARIGGDEFVVLMPGEDEDAGRRAIARIFSLVDANNRDHPGAPLSLSIGCATAANDGDSLEATMSRADDSMYEAKRAFYATTRHDRRSRPAPLD